MEDPNQLTLHEDARIIPFEAVADQIRDRLPDSGGSYVLSRTGTRHGSIVLDEQGAKLVKLLASGSLLTDAIKQLAVEESMLPDVVAKEAFPLIKTMIDRKYLKKKTGSGQSTEGEKTVYRFKVDDIFEGHTILRRVQLLEDTEIYQIRLRQGGLAALKLLREGHRTAASAFKRESLILERLGGVVSPKLIEAQFESDPSFMIMEWLDGEQAQMWASRVRNLPSHVRYGETLHMCREIVRAYIHLHRHGVMHSDIYPKNLMMQPDGSARIIDFGYSSDAELDRVLGKLPRNTNPYLKPPDLARYELENRRSEAPPPSPSSEVYSVGGLLYLLITGFTYVAFGLENATVLRQICEAPMVPFAQRGLHGWDELERVIRTMLAKDPAERYASMEKCLEALNGLKEEQVPVFLEVTSPSLDESPILRELATTAVPSPFQAPSASLNYGGAGVAYALLRSAYALDDRSLVSAADIWAAHAHSWMEASPDGCLCERLGITSDVVGPYAVLHRGEGARLVQALAAHSQLDSLTLRGMCIPFASGIHKKEALLEFIFGKAGLLNAIQQLSYLVIENEPLIRIGNELAADILAEISSFPSLADSPVQYVGFAHGWAGILYSLVSWGRRYDRELLNNSLPFLHQLAEHRVRTRLGSFWPIRFDRPIQGGDNSSWCNGTAGFTVLWTEAYVATSDSQWLVLAREAARHCATHYDNSSSICCGLAGRAYALAILASASGEEEWWESAQLCLTRSTRSKSDIEGYPHSLFKGFLGLELARLEIRRDKVIVFPTLASDMYGEPLPVGPFAITGSEHESM